MERALALIDKTTRLKPSDGWAFEEPDALRAIRRARPGKFRLPRLRLSEDAPLDRIHGGWTGRSCGCLLGCHTNSSAQIVALSLLWGDRDFGRTICCAVMPGFDTDCNGATAGSVLGVMLGRRALPAIWTTQMQDRLETGVHGYHSVSIPDMARNTLEIVRALHQ
jgi:hypothetical protein